MTGIFPLTLCANTETSEPAEDPTLLDDWHVVGFSSDVAAGGLAAVRLLGRELVVWRETSSGEVHVWEDLCIHRGSKLSRGWVKGDTIVCPYHGWHYDGTAQCTKVPATPRQTPPRKARALPYRSVERYGFIWASLGNPPHDIPRFPEWDDDTFIKEHAGDYRWRTSGFRAVENFVDATHFPWVHSDVNGVQTEPDEIERYDVFRDQNGLRTSEIVVFQPYGDPRQVPVNAGYSYQVMRPLIAYFSKRVAVAEGASKHIDSPDRFCTYFTAQPVDDVNCIIRICTARNFAPELTRDDVLRRQDLVYMQDGEICETQRPERIPLDLRQELHHNTDRLGAEYRRWLSEIGVSYGTS